jgi:hypothetical protein
MGELVYGTRYTFGAATLYIDLSSASKEFSRGIGKDSESIGNRGSDPEVVGRDVEAGITEEE